MSTVTSQINHSSTSFAQRNTRTLSTKNVMTNDRPSDTPVHKEHFRSPLPSIRESLPINSTTNKSSSTANSFTTTTRTTSNSHSRTNEETANKTPQRTYTYSNPPRVSQLTRKSTSNNGIRRRVISAPDGNSPRSKLNQPKSSSANGALIPRVREESNDPTVPSSSKINQCFKPDEKEKESLRALMKEKEKSKVPKAVQSRRILLLFPRSPTRQDRNSSLLSNSQTVQSRNSPTALPKIPDRDSFHSSEKSQPSDVPEPEMADSVQLAEILARIQDDWNPTEMSSQHRPPMLDLSKYDFDVANPADATTFKLSPRTLKPNEELEARLRFPQYYPTEIRQSSNARYSPLIASIITENNLNTLENGTNSEPTFTIKLNPTNAINPLNVFDDCKPLESARDNDVLQLCYDATLKCFYDPNTGRYYDLTSA